MSNFWSDETLDALAECSSPDALHWAVTGYRAGVEDGTELGYQQAETDMAEAWAPVAADVRRRAGQPSHDELVKRRTVDPEAMEPCPQKCKTCATCWAYEVWYHRGRRDFLGLAREAELEQQQAKAS